MTLETFNKCMTPQPHQPELDTPESDKQILNLSCDDSCVDIYTHDLAGKEYDGDVVPITFARQLERRNRELEKAKQELQDTFNAFHNAVKTFSESSSVISCFGLGFLSAVLEVAKPALTHPTTEKE